MGKNAAAFVLACLGQEVVDVAVEIGGGFVHDEEGGPSFVLGYDGALQYGLKYQRDEDTAKVGR